MLVVGPVYRTLRFVLSKVRSFTTDFGTEFSPSGTRMRSCVRCLVAFWTMHVALVRMIFGNHKGFDKVVARRSL